MKSFTIIALIACALVTICAGHETQTQQQSGSGSYTDTLLRGIKRLAERTQAEGLLDIIRNRECHLVCPITTVCSLQFGFPRCVPIYRRSAVADSSSHYYYNQPLSLPFVHGQADLRGAMALVGNLNIPLATVDTSYTEPLPSLAHGQASISGGFTATGKATVPISTEEDSYNNRIASQRNEPTVVQHDNTVVPVKTDITVTTVDAHHNEPILPLSRQSHRLSDIVNALALARRTNGYQPSFGRPSTSTTFDFGYGVNNCGYVPPECRAIPTELNTSFKYTFDYTMNRCVRINVCSTCTLLDGARFNLFDSRFDCNRFCQ